MSTTTQKEPVKKLEFSQPPSLDASNKLWKITGFILVAILCLAIFHPTFSIGFLLDDFFHIDYLSRAAHGDWQELLAKFTGKWSGSTDNLTCYRPAASASMFLDYLFWQANAFGYHLTNILMFIACSWLVGLVALELKIAIGQQPTWLSFILPALIFALYPLHVESVAWIIGRVDVLCALFFLGSVFTYLRFARLHRPIYLFISVGSFLLALPSKEMAVTIPAIITLVEIVLLPTFKKQSHNSISNSTFFLLSPRLGYLGLFWLALILYALWRTAILGTIVGGYGHDNLGTFFNSWHSFIDKASILKLFLPVNEELHLSPNYGFALMACYVILAFLAIRLIILRSINFRLFAFLSLWIIIALLPTFQIWHIYPNLVGSRLFFISSAPLAILLALPALPISDTTKTNLSKVCSALGILSAATICSIYCFLLMSNLIPWLDAGKQMITIQSQVRTVLEDTPDGKRTLFLDLPQDYKGAGMVGRPEYLKTLCRPPFTQKDLSQKLLTAESPVAGSREFLYPSQFSQIIQLPRLHRVLKWDKESHRFALWTPPQGLSNYDFSVNPASIPRLTWQPKEFQPADERRWSLCQTKTSHGVISRSHIRIYPGSDGVTLLLPPITLNPLAAKTVAVKLEFTSFEDQSANTNLLNKIKLVWQSSKNEKERKTAAEHDTLKEAPFDEIVNGEVLSYTGRYRKWSWDGSIKRLGLRLLPGNYVVTFYGLSTKSDQELFPETWIFKTQDNLSKFIDPHLLWLTDLNKEHPALLHYDATKVKDATQVKFLVTESGSAFINSPCISNLENQHLLPLKAEIQQGTKGTIRLPDELLMDNGIHQVRVIALNRKGGFVGWASDPLTVRIKNPLQNGFKH